MEFPQHYNPKEAEPRWQQYWEKNNIYKADVNTKKKVYSIDTPPPTVSGKMHLGHAFSFSQQDFIARYKRMRGYEVYYPFGTDDNGLATEKLVQKEKKVNLRNLPRHEVIKLCLDFLNQERPRFVQDWKNIGMSCDFDLVYSTIDDYSRKISQKSFLDLAKKGLVYRKEGPILWDRVFQTAIAQAELEDKKLRSTLNYVKAQLIGAKNTYLIYATTRPELLFACVGMSIEEAGKYVRLKVGDEFWVIGAATYEEKFKDFKYRVVEKLSGKDLLGKKVKIPISNNIVPISDDISVKADYGTGIVYYCTYGGLDCVEWMARHPEAKPINILNKDGTLNEKNEKYAGKLTADARKEIIADLEAQRELIKKEEIEHIVNVGERSGTEVEYIISKQWYVQYLDKKEKFLEASGQLQWHPQHMKHRLDNWIKGLNWDWGFSRQRNFGIPIPVWYDKQGKVYYADEKQLPVDPVKDRPLSAPKGIELIPETDVFDTWFTSASSPFLAINLVEGKPIHQKLFPMSLRPQAHDIINFWLFYTLAKTQLLHDVNPWSEVAISGFVLDPKGEKMSKSKGNVIAPQDVIQKFSADAIRFWAATSKLGEDLPYQEKDVLTGQKFVTKLWNASKFALMHLEDYSDDYSDKEEKKKDVKVAEVFDRWLLSKLHKVIKESTDSFENYEYSRNKAEVENFFWHTFCDNYLEIIKDRLYNPDRRGKEQRKSAQYALYHSLLVILKMTAPIMPHITEEIYHLYFAQKEGKKSIHLSLWPEFNQKLVDEKAELSGDLGVDIINAVRKYKSEQQLSMKEGFIRLILGNDDLEFHAMIKSMEADLKAVLNVKEIVFMGKTSLESDKFNVKIGLVK